MTTGRKEEKARRISGKAMMPCSSAWPALFGDLRRDRKKLKEE